MEHAHYLFVYDKLCTIEGHPVHNYLRGVSDFMGAATVGGIKIELDDGGVGLMISGNANEKVVGELYRIHEGCEQELFEVLDRFEGCGDEDEEPHEFFRHKREVTLLEGGEVHRAWVYIYRS